MIGITGSTGALGGLVTQALAADPGAGGCASSCATRARARVGAEVAVCEYADEEAAVAALRGSRRC